ncbi:response regulator [Shewanella sp. 3_MG-2023]|uniref:response regulator transcription factor n=1 Tax=Shewanella sp. 3_MG-2023 TaxID=3062635 RepID=UPI0026E3189B|nr:response regulator [Shewanella sp. 3_MG-2023]MDO6775078.1 response regulator [Shewanella sp. 3_MG-2023]
MNNLLIIEDDSALAAVLASRLSRHGFNCVQCNSAEQSLLKARQHAPSHILLDMKLADKNGLALITPLRQYLPNALIVLLTGYASIATAVKAIRLGADNYLAKPADTQTLLNALNVSPNEQNEPLLSEQPISPKLLEWEHIQQVLTANNGNISATARLLGMHRRTLQRKLLKKPITDTR